MQFVKLGTAQGFTVWPKHVAVVIAALNLEACTWQYDGELLVIESASTQFKRYHVAYNGCDCKAGATGRPCWHMAAYKLIQRAAEVALVPAKPKMSDEHYAAVLAACDDLC